MSLQVDDGGRRGRSRSRSRDRRDRDEDAERTRTRANPDVVDAVPYPSSHDYPRDPAASAAYEYERLSNWPSAPPDDDDDHYRRPGREDPPARYADPRRESDYRSEKEPRASDRDRDRDREREKVKDRDGDRDSDREKEMERQRKLAMLLPSKYRDAEIKTAEPPESPRYSRDSRDKEREKERAPEKDRKERRKEKLEEDLAYGSIPGPSKYSRPESPPSAPAYPRPSEYDRPESPPSASAYSRPSNYDRPKSPPSPAGYGDRKSSRYDRPESPSGVQYGTEPVPLSSERWGSPPEGPSYAYAQPKPYEYAKTEDHGYGALSPGGGKGGQRAPSPGPQSYQPSIMTAEPPGALAAPLKSAMKRDRSRSPMPPAGRMSNLSLNTTNLSVNTGLHAGASLSSAPPSPLLESYHGTWQSMPPMPSPLLLPSYGSSSGALEAVSPIGSDNEQGDKRRSRRARFHDPVEDAERLAKALKGERRRPDTEPLIELLPGMTHEQIMELRSEYKRLVKTGSDRKGVNIAKHIRARLKDEDPNLMKACYAVALGRWESEAYWANFWYHSDKARRELLIEALMGRTNDEIRAIRDGFSDKKYQNSLTRCMKQELKEDKFKKAVLMVLDEQRMEETDGYGRPLRIDTDLVRADVEELYQAVKSERGGESLMIRIVTQRSDSHLREVLREYKSRSRGGNFAKDALKKSGNLVGELLAHILNGVINKPVRDAMLLHHAITSSKRDDLRKELLISRLVRYHWDNAHMIQVKKAYRDQYGRDLQDAVKDATSGEWGEFCRALCITRMPDHVKKIERVSDSRRER
ncbi:hypothetical protein V8F06_011552 [Rhypophila decipiens]